MSNIQLRFLEQELGQYATALGKAADTVLDNEVSKYPIFIAHQEQIEIGLPIVDREKVSGNWAINVSTLEEFVTKQLIQMDKVDEFRTVYKDPRKHLCFFVLSEFGATFNFLPR